MAMLDEVAFSWMDVRFSRMRGSVSAITKAHVSMSSCLLAATRASFHTLRTGRSDSTGWTLAIIRSCLCTARLCL